MLSFVPTPIGNLSDISLHALQILEQAEIVLCEDTRVTKKLFMLLSKNILICKNFPNLTIENKKFLSFHSHNQHDFIAKLTPDFFQSNVIFCTDAGMPNISDPGALLLQYARKHNVQYEVLLGGSAFNHAFVHSGLEGNFAFCGFLPHKQHDRQTQLKSFLIFHKHLHLIFYESPKRLRESLHDINLILPHAQLYIYKELTKMYQHEMIGNAQTILESLPSQIRGEYCIVIEKQLNFFNDNNEILQLTKEDILTLDINPKQKAKLLSRISTKNAKEWYAWILKNS